MKAPTKRPVQAPARKPRAATPKVAVLRGVAFEAAMRGALAEMEADVAIQISPGRVAKRAGVNRSTLYDRRKDSKEYVHDALIADINAAIERRKKDDDPKIASSGDRAVSTALLASEAVQQRAEAESARKRAAQAVLSERKAVLVAVAFATALRAAWPVGKEKPAMLERFLREQEDAFRGSSLKDDYVVAVDEGVALANEMAPTSSTSNHALKAARVSPIRRPG